MLVSSLSFEDKQEFYIMKYTTEKNAKNNWLCFTKRFVSTPQTLTIHKEKKVTRRF